jgi:hypothetical protein
MSLWSLLRDLFRRRPARPPTPPRPVRWIPPSGLVSVKTTHGTYFTVNADRTLVATGRATALEFVVVRDQVAIKAPTGYVTAEDGGGRELTADRAAVGPWELFDAEVTGPGFALRALHRQYVSVSHTGVVRADQLAVGTWETLTLDVAPTVVTTARPLVGPLRTHDKLFADDTGPRRVLFYSWFPALRVLRDDPVAFTEQVDRIAAAEYQGFRTFVAVGGWEYWAGREVAPVTFHNNAGTRIEAWPDFDEQWRTLLRLCRERQLRLHVTTGDAQFVFAGNPSLELETHRRLARIAQEEGGSAVIAVWEAHNEYWQNSLYGDTPDQDAQDARILGAVREVLPQVLTMRGSLNSEEPADLERSVGTGDVCAIHQTRSPAMQAIRRTFGLYYWQGHPHFFHKPFWFGEPPGMGDDVYQPLPSREYLLGVHAVMALTGYAVNYFDGPSVRSRVPIGAGWGFAEIPRLLARIPDDIGTWGGSAGPNGAIWYWHRGAQFFTVTVEGWNYAPPRPVAAWTAIGPDGEETGEGDLRLVPGYQVRFIQGTFR